MIAVAISVTLVAAVTVASMSPEEAVARRQPPILPGPTAQVERQVLRDVVTGPCDLRQETGTVTAAEAGQGPRVITAVGVAAGDEVSTGSHLVTVSGDPLLTISSQIPFYRDLAVDDVGDDVQHLEEALVDAGLLESSDRRFDLATARGMEALYQQAGIDLSGTGVDPSRFTFRLARSVPPGAVVQQVHVSVGHEVEKDDPLLTLSTGGGSAECVITGDAPISVGDLVEVTVGTDPHELPVASVGSAEAPGQQVVSVTLSDELAEATMLEIRHVVSSSDGAVLTVPIAALTQGPSGNFEVTKVVPDGAERIPVTTGIAAGGWIEVTADGLEAEDEVRLNGEGTPAAEDDA